MIDWLIDWLIDFLIKLFNSLGYRKMVWNTRFTCNRNTSSNDYIIGSIYTNMGTTIISVCLPACQTMMMKFISKIWNIPIFDWKTLYIRYLFVQIKRILFFIHSFHSQTITRQKKNPFTPFKILIFEGYCARIIISFFQ